MADVEHVMTFAGVGLAATVATLAFLAIERNDGAPRIYGQEHLALFAQPSRAAGDGDTASTGATLRSPPQPRETILPSIDYLSTATIPAERISRAAVRQVRGDVVVIEGRTGLLELRIGESAPGFGRLREVRSVQGRPVAFFADGPAAGQSSR